MQNTMEIDAILPTRLNAIAEAPEPLRSAVSENIPSESAIRLLVHAPAFSTAAEKTPATVLAVTNEGWLVATETEEGGATVEKSNFSETLFFELTSMLLFGQLKIYFATVGTAYFTAVRFDTVGEEYYLEAIDIMLRAIGPTKEDKAEKHWDTSSMLEAWPTTFRAEANRYLPKGQRLLAAIHWPAVAGGFQRELAPAGSLLVTEREAVVISEEKISPRQHAGDIHKFGGIITFFPSARLADFHVSHHECSGVLTLQAHAMHGGEKLEITFPSDYETTVRAVMQKALVCAGSSI
jgi:hypothetical protein